MATSKFTSPLQHPLIYFMLAVVPTIAAFSFYGINMVKWRNRPDFGWRAMYESGPNVAADLFERAKAAGLQIGDQIVAINGQKYSTFEELFFEVRNDEPGSTNTYTVLRNGKEVQIDIITGRIGIIGVLKRSGPLFFLGLIYFLIGMLVFLMKPKAKESFLFLLMTASLGAMLCYQSPSDLFSPLLLFDVRLFIEVFMPAPMMHLALRFPKTRSFLIKWPKLVAFPYLLSLTLFICMKMTSTAYWRVPTTLNQIWNLSIMLSVLTFLVSVIWNRLRDHSAAVKLQSQTILLGIFIGFFIPAADLISRSIFSVYLFPDPVIGFMLFLTAFPLSIGFTIVKYDLFAIDAVIKRTYGYLLTTAAIASIYAIVISLLNFAFGRFAFTSSPAFPVIFILAVLFFFNPVRYRVQRFIDRVFYRLEYDYQETVHKISETMRTLLGLNEIGKSIMNFTLETLFIDSGSVLLLNRDKSSYVTLIREGENCKSKTNDHIIVATEPATVSSEADSYGQHSTEIENGSDLTLPVEDPLIEKITERKKEVTIYDIQENPFFEDVRDSCEDTIRQLGAILIVPIIYENRLTGLISLGKKKSGKFYRKEDIKLLNILANQGSVAIENAIRLEEIIEKERVKTKILDAFGKYVTREVRDQILGGHIPLDGEAKDVTVLFADLRDFTTLAESSSPKDVVKIINGYFSEMADAISKHNGLVLQFIGDEIEAVFGAPLFLDDHPTHAVRAAIEMRERLVFVNKNLEQRGYFPLRHGIGIHTGNVVAANIGSEDRLSYALVGDTVNVASRIQGLNKKFDTDILISATTVERLADNIEVKKLPATTVKGKRELVEIFKLI